VTIIDLNEILNEAVPAWAALTGTKLGATSYVIRLGQNTEFQEYDLRRIIDDLNDARRLDHAGTTAILLLRGLFEAYAKERHTSAWELLHAPADVETDLARYRAFHELISQPACLEAVATFRDTVRQAAAHYGYDVGTLDEVLDERVLGDLRLAAARSVESLSVHQFAQGDPSQEPPQYNREIFEFSNINSFIGALHKQWISGITLAIIRGEDPYQAYFVLGFRNGDNVTVLTDHTRGDHPEYHRVTRRPDRRLEERARLHWFPYGLLKVDPVKREQYAKAIVARDAGAIPVGTIAQLAPSEFIWLTLLFGLVADKYGDRFRTPGLSYTGEMVVTPHALVEASSALVRNRHYQPLVLPRLTPETTTAEAAGTEVYVGHNAWMEDRYGSKVPAVLFNVVGDQQALEIGKSVAKRLPGKIRVDDESLPIRHYRYHDLNLREPLAPKALDPTNFGTKDQIAADRAWAARQNKMMAIQRLAVAEFVKKGPTIARWYQIRVTRNLPFILAAFARGELIAPRAHWSSQWQEGDVDRDPFPSNDKLLWEEGSILRRKIAKSWHHAFPGERFSVKNPSAQFGSWNSDRRYVACFREPPMRATVFGLISPDNPRAVAILCGISEDKLPWALQHWYTGEPYTGNSILRRVDPLDSVLDNPWRHLDLQVTIAFSKRAYKALLKEHGIKETHAVEGTEDEEDAA
jgi:hypothetical protein